MEVNQEIKPNKMLLCDREGMSHLTTMFSKKQVHEKIMSAARKIVRAGNMKTVQELDDVLHIEVMGGDLTFVLYEDQLVSIYPTQNYRLLPEDL